MKCLLASVLLATLLAAAPASPAKADPANYGIESTEALRRRYRLLLTTSPGAETHLAGVILFDETAGQQADDGTPLPAMLAHLFF